ncbi:MAG: phosphoglycerate mutase, partial [Desulfonatronovibrio sp.]
VTSDHSTPSKGDMVHCGEPVPLILMGSGVRIDQVKQFDEVSAAQGCLGFVRGREFMYIVLNCLDMGKLAGLMDTPHDQPYWPGKSQPFELI